MSVSAIDAGTVAASPVLEVRNLAVRFRTRHMTIAAVEGVNFDLREGETLALVGESGAGKSMTALAVMRLVQSEYGQSSVEVEGEVLFREGSASRVNLCALGKEDMRRIRGRAMSMVFQEPMTALNPLMRVGEQIAEAILVHERVGAKVARELAIDMLHRVSIPDPRARHRAYPHELSGGMRQRIVIAMALACRPRLLIADEPTTALDVTVQAQVLALVRSLQRELGMAVLFITHDLGIVAQMADRVAVMYAGRIVEQAPIDVLFAQPHHPYTAALFQAMPNAARRASEWLPAAVHDAATVRVHEPGGCAFRARCPCAGPRCRDAMPPLEELGAQRLVRCWYPRAALSPAATG